MDWERVLKKTTHVLAIVAAVACGVIAGSLPFKKYERAHTVSESALWLWDEHRSGRLSAEEMEKKETAILRTERVAEQQMKDRKKRRTKEFPNKQQEVEEILEYRRQTSFWYNRSTAELTGLTVLYGLGGAVVGFIVGWVVLWYSGLYFVYRYGIYKTGYPWVS